ncbi:MAG TPA: hypothetical protein PLZ51_14065, partial [Aggregatilineales bacterium]|nr:hypothetical protein [Aggregatilineales bacterium]
DLETNKLTFVTTPFTVDILNIAMEHELYSENIMTPRGFFGYSGYLDLSPNQLNAIFLKNNARNLDVYDLYVLDLTNQMSSPNLIQSLQKEINAIRWYDDNHIIVITSPEYGYQSYDTHLICLDGSCNYEITDTERLGYLVNANPYININQEHLIFLTDYDNDEIYLRIYNIPNQGFIYENRIPNIFSLHLSPRMVEGDTGVYFLYDDHVYRAEYLSNEIVEIGNVQRHMGSDWLIMPENRFIVIRETTGMRVLCY